MRLELPDPATGDVRLMPSGARLRPRLAEQAFLALPDALGAAIFVSNPPHVSYKLRERYEIDGEHATVIAFFTNGELQALSISLIERHGSSSWADWSESAERALKKRQDDIIERTYGGAPPYRFPWGELSSHYDPRGGSAHITVAYR